MRFMHEGGQDALRAVLKFPGFASIISHSAGVMVYEVYGAVGHRQLAPAFSSMAELPVPPALAIPVVVAEEPMAGIVPPDTEMKLPPVVEAKVFSLYCFWVFRFLAGSACFGPSVLILRSA